MYHVKITIYVVTQEEVVMKYYKYCKDTCRIYGYMQTPVFKRLIRRQILQWVTGNRGWVRKRYSSIVV